MGPYLDSFLAAGSELGYARSTVRERLWVLGDLERWLKRKRLALVALEEQVLKQFLERRRRQGRLRRSDARTVHHFLEHLREKGVVQSPEPTIDESPLTTLQERYENYLQKERGLCPATGARYWAFLRQFIEERFGRGPICLWKLVPDDVSGFVLRHARSGSPGVGKLMVTALRSFCRFLFRCGETERDLAGAIPTVAVWRLAEVPRYLEAEDVERVLQACDRRTSVGRRDYAILLLLARLGLRAGEIIGLELDDVDWRAGVLTVRGKGRYHDQLPLPHDVGEALATYGKIARPAPPGVFSSAIGRRIGVLPTPVLSVRWSAAPCGELGCNRATRELISYDTRWRPACSVAARPWPRSVRSFATACPTPRKSMRKST